MPSDWKRKLLRSALRPKSCNMLQIMHTLTPMKLAAAPKVAPTGAAAKTVLTKKVSAGLTQPRPLRSIRRLMMRQIPNRALPDIRTSLMSKPRVDYPMAKASGT